MNWPQSVRGSGTKLFVSESGNNRVLVWNSIPSRSGHPADFALGQQNLTSNNSNNGGISASTLSSPWGLAIAGGRLFVADTANKRVLGWNELPSASGQAAHFVLGQPNLTSNTSNSGGISGSSMDKVAGVHSDGQKLFVADYGNNRVLVWNAIPTMTAQPADIALGQPNLMSNTVNNGGVSGASLNMPYGMFSDGEKFFVNDAFSGRVLGWSSQPAASGQSAAFAIGQPDLLSAGLNKGIPPSAVSMHRPTSASSDGSKMVVVDSLNNRVLIYNSIPVRSGAMADVVLGQADFGSGRANSGGLSGASLSLPHSAIIVGSKLFVSDSANHRVLVWNSIPTSNGQRADFVLGQPDLSANSSNNGGLSGSSMSSPTGLFSDGSRLYVSDSNNHRVLVWDGLPSGSGQSAHFALGQAGLVTNSFGTGPAAMWSPTGIYGVGTSLYVADTNNHRILIWESLPAVSGAAAHKVLGQPDAQSNTANNQGITGATLNNPRAVRGLGGKIYVADSGNNRVLIWNSIPARTGEPAAAVFGQENMMSATANSGGLSASSLWNPQALATVGTRLFITDFGNSRVLALPAP